MADEPNNKRVKQSIDYFEIATPDLICYMFQFLNYEDFPNISYLSKKFNNLLKIFESEHINTFLKEKQLFEESEKKIPYQNLANCLSNCLHLRLNSFRLDNPIWDKLILNFIELTLCKLRNSKSDDCKDLWNFLIVACVRPTKDVVEKYRVGILRALICCCIGSNDFTNTPNSTVEAIERGIMKYLIKFKIISKESLRQVFTPLLIRLSNSQEACDVELYRSLIKSLKILGQCFKSDVLGDKLQELLTVYYSRLKMMLVSNATNNCNCNTMQSLLKVSCAIISVFPYFTLDEKWITKDILGILKISKWLEQMIIDGEPLQQETVIELTAEESEIKEIDISSCLQLTYIKPKIPTFVEIPFNRTENYCFNCHHSEKKIPLEGGSEIIRLPLNHFIKKNFASVQSVFRELEKSNCQIKIFETQVEPFETIGLTPAALRKEYRELYQYACEILQPNKYKRLKVIID